MKPGDSLLCIVTDCECGQTPMVLLYGSDLLFGVMVLQSCRAACCRHLRALPLYVVLQGLIMSLACTQCLASSIILN